MTDFQPFVQERIMSKFEQDVDFNLASGFKEEQTVVLYSDEPLPFSVSGILARYE